MYCPRYDHFVRLQSAGDIGKCGHMTKHPSFRTFDEMQNSKWLEDIKKESKSGKWPDVCKRCKLSEETNKTSVRLDSIQRDKQLKAIDKKYLIVGGVLDNICNSACQTCYEGLSSKIGSLKKSPVRVANIELVKTIPQDRILEFDISGGEPTFSPNYKKLLKQLPKNLKIIRINTNGHKFFDYVLQLLAKNIKVIMTVSFDGLGDTHDYVRWPIKFTNVDRTIKRYNELQLTNKNFKLNLWTTVSCLNVGQLYEIKCYAEQNNIDHSYAFLDTPRELAIQNTNRLTMDARLKYTRHKDSQMARLASKLATGQQNSPQLTAFIKQQDSIRKINFFDYFKRCPQDL